MYPDFKELLSVLNAHRVKYLVVGAYAVSIHAQPRATKDIDILIEADADNAEAVFAALAQFGAPLQGLTSADFAEEGPFFRIGRDPIGVDILTTMPGVSFDAAWLADVDAIRTAIKSQEARLDRREPKIDQHGQPATNFQEKED